jgi:rubredoxin
MSKFQKTPEDFVCENCSTKVIGNGYTNHCPECLWSKHVDINPGDREESCGAMMEPIEVRLKGTDIEAVLHRCMICGQKRWNKISPEDNMEVLMKLFKKQTDIPF